MNRFCVRMHLFQIVFVVVTVLAATGASAANACYWSQCSRGCASGATAMFKKTLPGSACTKTWCCREEVAKKLQKDDGYMCRARCGNQPSAYGGYFQCMDKCLGRNKESSKVAPQHCQNAVKLWCQECTASNKKFCRPKGMSYGACVQKLGCDV